MRKVKKCEAPECKRRARSGSAAHCEAHYYRLRRKSKTPFGLIENRDFHDMSNSAEYRAYKSAKNRCTNKKVSSYKYYGARGISMCPKWNTFSAFYKDMGSRPSDKHSLDRIDVNKGYSKQNCRWVTRIEQMNNKRSNLVISILGQKKTLAQWARYSGIDRRTISSRFRKTGRNDESLFTPVKKRVKNEKQDS